MGIEAKRQFTFNSWVYVESFVIYDHTINYNHSSPIGCCLKFSHLIGPEGGFQLDGCKFQWS